MAKIGYARVSTLDQNPDLQLDALSAAGCGKIFTDKASGAKSDRPELTSALEYLRAGDTLVVWKLDRLGRSLKHLIEIVETLAERGIEFQSVQEGFDTGSPAGKMIFQIFGSIAEFERAIIKERVSAGLAAANARGRKGGRPRVISETQVAAALELIGAGHSKRGPAEVLGVSHATLDRALKLKAS